MNKKILIGLAIIVVIGMGVIFYVLSTNKSSEPDKKVAENITEVDQDYSVDTYEVIGKSVDGRDIRAFKLGTGDKTLVYIGAIHGGYEWNSALLSYELIDYLTANPNAIPSDIEVIVIPVANPDGLNKVIGTSSRFLAANAPQFDYANEITLESPVVSGRFNANNVDLNRNFDCKWQSDAVWRDYTVGAGTEAFSEPESRAIRNYLIRKSPKAVVFFHSASNGVYTSFCEGDALGGTSDLLDVYGNAAGYPRYDDYPYYKVTGDATDWLSTLGIPAITVELSKHTDTEWGKNLAGIEAMFRFYSDIQN
jgi:hypothetical protein